MSNVSVEDRVEQATNRGDRVVMVKENDLEDMPVAVAHGAGLRITLIYKDGTTR